MKINKYIVIIGIINTYNIFVNFNLYQFLVKRNNILKFGNFYGNLVI